MREGADGTFSYRNLAKTPAFIERRPVTGCL